VLLQFDSVARKQINKHKTLFRDETGETIKPTYCYDRPNLHLAAVPTLLQHGVNAPFLSHYSPDMNKPIEHVFGYLTTQMQVVMRENRRKESIEFYKAQLEGLFYKIDARSVKRDVESLHVTCQKILDAHGDWAPSDVS
jgi:hypothetical protein